MLIFVEMFLSGTDYEANILTLSDFWDPPQGPPHPDPHIC